MGEVSPRQDSPQAIESGNNESSSPLFVSESPPRQQNPTREMKDFQRRAAETIRARMAAEATAGPQIPEISEDRSLTPKVNDRGAAKFAQLEKLYAKKKSAGNLSMEEEVAYLKAKSAESARLRKLREDTEYDRSVSAQLSEDEGFSGSEGPAAPPLEMSDDEPQPKKRGRKRKADADDSGAISKKRTKTGASKKVPGTKYNEKQLGDALKAQSKKGKVAKSGKEKSAKGPDTTSVSNLWSSDVFKDSAATRHLPDQPTFEGDFSRNKGRKDEAMKKLMASVPEEDQEIAKSDQKYLDQAIKDFTGVASVKAAPDGNWYVKGMRSTLKHYQVIGTAFMRKRENSSGEPKGGILADEMGLGKTVMALANIINGLPKASARNKVRATLVVASPALVTQWFNEIQQHCLRNSENKQHGIGTVMIHKAGNRVNSNNDLEFLQSADIVLTTYHSVMASYPKAVVPPHLVTANQKDQWWTEFFAENKGLLHQAKFLRVVLDESQTIKNHRSRVSMACRALDSKFRWCITGTPLLNSVTEIYPYLKFLRFEYAGSFKLFKENFCTPESPQGYQRLAWFLRKVVLRRTHLTQLFGGRLLNLPSNSEHTLRLEFNPLERTIYEIVKARMVNRINSMAKSGQRGLQKNYSNIWVMILRLRQLTAHCLIIQDTITDILEREDFEKLNNLVANEGEWDEEGKVLLMHLKQILAANRGRKNMKGSGGTTLTENDVVATDLVDMESMEDAALGGKHGLSFRFKRYLDDLKKSEQWASLCSGCRQEPEQPHITSCLHLYCLECALGLQAMAARRGMDQARCDECGTPYDSLEPCAEAVNVEQESTASPDSTPPAGKKSKKAKDDSWLSKKGDMLPSAKTLAIKAQVLEWLEQDPEAKIIIFTQHLAMIHILGRVCQAERWGYCVYSGAISHDARDKSIAEFRNNKETQIMLASLRAGGLGLNLTAASRVLLVDPYWNQAIENQAFSRCYRIGQSRETEMTRLVVKNTIDEAMMDLKARKQQEIDQVITESKRGDTLDVNELMHLFGEVGEDSDGMPFIFAEGTEVPAHLRLAHVDRDDEEQIMGNEE